MSTMQTMAGKPKTFADELRQALAECGESRYSICRAIGVTEALLSRFINGYGWLGETTMNALAKHLGWHLAKPTKAGAASKAKGAKRPTKAQYPAKANSKAARKGT